MGLHHNYAIDFATRNVYCMLGEGRGGGERGGEDEVFHNNVSQILAITDFSSKEITRKILSARKNTTTNIALSQTSSLDLNKSGGGNYILDCRSAPFG